MSLQALAQEKFWANKAECEDAEKAYYMRLSGAKAPAPKPAPKADEEEFDLFGSDEEPAAKPAKAPKKAGKAKEQAQGSSSPSSLAAEIAKARQHIKNSLECVDGIAAMAGGANADVVKKLKDLEIENKNLKKVTDDLKSMVLKLENRVAALEKGGAKAAPAPAKKEESEDEDVDLFGSESEEEEDAEKDKVRQERLAAYAAKKAKKPALIAKTSVLLDVKPWDDETDMDAMLKSVKTIEQDGLLWGASKLVPVGYGISKLSIVCVVEDEKVSIEELQEKIEAFEDFVQSCDVASMQKI